MPAHGGELRSERHVVRSAKDGIETVVRRVRVGDDAAARCERLRRIQSEAPIHLTPIQHVSLRDNIMEVVEDHLDGFTIADATRQVQHEISVNVALSIIYDITVGLQALHSIEHDEPGHLIHGRLGPEHVSITGGGQVFVSGLNGSIGDPERDVDGVMRLMRHLLEGRSRTKEGALLLDRLSALTFTNCRDLGHSINLYLERQAPDELQRRRLGFATRVLDDLQIDDEPTAAAEDIAAYPEEFWGALGGDADFSRFDDRAGSLPTIDGAEIEDLSDEGQSTAVDFIPDLSDGAGSETVEAVPDAIDLARSRQDSVLGPLPSPETDVLEGDAVVDANARSGLLGRASTAAVESSAVVVGDYKVVASIGRGGMGEIYLAREKKGGSFGKLVALKVLSADGDDDEEALGMLLDEAAIMARIHHPNVLRVVDFGRARGRYFLATEYLEGRPLVRVMIEAYNREGGIDYGVIAAMGADAANGLFAAHTATNDVGLPLDVVHRDISPQNIFITYRGAAKVIDFGVARATERVSKTEIGFVKGKAAYMSPEQAEGRPVDARSDVFSLGVCLWEMTAGRRLFKKDNEYDTLLAVQSDPIPKPTVLRGDPNPVLDHIILGALERDLDKRTPTAREFALQLIDYASGVGVSDRERAVAELLERLFGEVSRQERDLIASLEVRAATPEEAEELQSISGVSTKSAIRRITWVAEPEGLEELDDFGMDFDVDEDPRDDIPPPSSSSSHVLDRVHEFQAQRSGSMSEASISDPFDGEPTRRLPSELLESMVVPSIEDAAIVSAEHIVPELEVSDAFQMIDAAPAQETAPVVPVVATKRPSKWPLAIGLISLLAIIGGAGAVWLFDDDPPPSQTEPPAPPPPSGLVAAVGRSERLDSLAETATTATITATASTASDASSPIQHDALTKTKNVSLDSFVRLLREQGVDATASEGTHLIDDGDGGTLAFDDAAAITRVETPTAEGFVVETKSKALTSVAWVGRARGGPWRVRSLSINDCPARIQIEQQYVSLRYGGQDIRMRHGGGMLVDVQLDRPDRAVRLEVDPLGLSFGEADPSSGAIHCRTGWWGSRVVLRRLPLGHYTLRWIGEGVAQTGRLNVTPTEVEGGKLVRRTGE